MNNFKYSKIVTYIYFEQSHEINIENLKIGDFFVVELSPVLNSNARCEKFYGKLLRKTNTTFSCYRYCDSSYTGGSKEFILKKSILDYEKTPVKYFKYKIKKIYKVTIHENKEKMFFTSSLDPSTFMDPQEYELIE
ncbi:hypothetical protein [Enterococcus casseliflavus]|uniref:hypothetical protein n=1 Tax=Enterococcus casseliflavus TaxID=37734 RepID=UPI001883293A|nr:hypothetical protein [Enterococcus casseliflavus]MBE9908913.1 hypothetical protein [Enterococcus casseliflavus]